MGTETTFPAPPEELRDAGRALWSAVGDDDLELRPDELAILAEACSTKDTIAALVEATASAPAMVDGSKGQQVVHPGLQELRQQRQLLATLLKQLSLPYPADEDGEPENGTGNPNWDGLTAEQRARKAAGKRWRG